jgi:hypothetical protein
MSDLSKEQRFRKVGDIAVGLLKVQRSFIDQCERQGTWLRLWHA